MQKQKILKKLKKKYLLSDGSVVFSFTNIQNNNKIIKIKPVEKTNIYWDDEESLQTINYFDINYIKFINKYK